MELAQRLNERFARLQEERQDAEKRWKKAVQYVMPMLYDWGDLGEWVDKRMDTTATEASALLADGMMGNLCPQPVNWFMFRFENNELNDDKALTEWLQEVQERIYEAMHRSTFYDVLPQFLKIGNVLGTSSMMIEESAGDGRINCHVPHPKEIYIAVDRQGIVDTIYRHFTLTAYQAVDFFGKEKLSRDILASYEKDPDTEYEFLHVIEPRKMRDHNKEDAVNFPYASYYLEKGKDEIIKEGGYKTFPFPTWRWEVRGNESYGYCPTDDAMPDILMANKISEAILVSAQKAVDPALMVPIELRGESDFSPGTRTYYKDPGRQVVPVNQGNLDPFVMELLNQTRERIRLAYKTQHFLMLMAQEGQMTAREVMERKSEKITVIGSTIGKFATEALDRILARILQIEADAGRLPPPPEGYEAQLSSATLKLDYLGPLAQAQKEMYAAQGVMQTLTTAAPIIQIWPEVRDKFKPEQMLELILESSGMPEKAIRSDEEYKKIQEMKAQQAAEQQERAMQIEEAKAMKGMEKRPEQGSMLDQVMGQKMGGM